MLRRDHFYRLSAAILLTGVMAACGRSQGLPLPTASNSPAVPSQVSITPTHTPTAEPPTATPIPLAALVNGEEISLAEFESELNRFLSAQEQLGTSPEVSPEKLVLDDLVDQVLLAQAARQAGFEISQPEVDQKIDRLTTKLGGEAALLEWMAAQDYSEQSFRKDLIRSTEAAWMRDQITAGAPESVEQVRARQILVYNSDQAREVQFQLQNGKDFATLAEEYDPVTGGDLGWFPRGYLNEPQLEEAAFSLQPGEFSPIIETPTGFYLLQVTERDPEHPLSPDARRVWQIKALRDWLEEQRSQGSIEILIPLE